MNINPLTSTDFYKADHRRQYPQNTTMVYSNFTPRSSRIFKESKGGQEDKVVFFGLQGFIQSFLIDTWNKNFFQKPKEQVVAAYKRRLDNALGKDAVPVEHIEALHDLQYLPIRIKALPEGSLVPMRVPVLTIKNLHPEHFWLVNYLETILSACLWKPSTSATIAYEYRKIFEQYSKETCDNNFHVQFQGHDFSFRGMSGLEDGMISGAAHLTSFVGTDTIIAIDYLEEMYQANSDQELVGTSVPATEHSVMAMGGQQDEIETFRRLIAELYPSGIVSIVSDTWDYWKVLTEYAPALKETILNRQENALGLAKLVFRPDCYDKKTKILTNNGWKFFKDLTDQDLVCQVDDNFERSFVKPTKIIKQEYEGPMCHFKDFYGKVDLKVTPNHRMVLVQNNEIRVVEAEKLGRYGHHKQKMNRTATAPSCPTHRLSPIERLKIAFQADGSFQTGCSPNHIRFSFQKDRKKERLIKILEESDIPLKFYDLQDGRVEFNIKLETAEFTKDFSWVNLNDLTKEWCKDFIEECSYWDSCRRSDDRFKFDTTNLAVANVVEEIALAAGYGALKSLYEDSRSEKFNDVITLHILKDSFIGGQSWEKEEVFYKGFVYCVTVPTGKVLVKRNRCTLVSGNSGNPHDIICGTMIEGGTTPEEKGSLEMLWQVFGGTINSKGYRVLSPRVGLIYGDSISLQTAKRILETMKQKGFAASNIVFGIGSFSYQHNTRDTFGFAMKATAGIVDEQFREIFKDPKTDSGTKKSARGLLVVEKVNDEFVMSDQVSFEEESEGELKTVFENGELLITTSLQEIRNKINETFHESQC